MKHASQGMPVREHVGRPECGERAWFRHAGIVAEGVWDDEGKVRECANPAGLRQCKTNPFIASRVKKECHYPAPAKRDSGEGANAGAPYSAVNSSTRRATKTGWPVAGLTSTSPTTRSGIGLFPERTDRPLRLTKFVLLVVMTVSGLGSRTPSVQSSVKLKLPLLFPLMTVLPGTQVPCWPWRRSTTR